MTLFCAKRMLIQITTYQNFSSGSFLMGCTYTYADMCIYIFTHIRTISELTKNCPYGFKSLLWTSGCFASLQQMKGERDVVLHFRAQNIGRESKGTFCDSLFLLHKSENGVRKNWLMYFSQNPILQKFKQWQKLTELIYRNTEILSRMFVRLDPERHKILTGEK